MLGNRPGSRPAEPEQPEKSGGGLQQQLALTMAQALTEMAAGMRYLVDLANWFRGNDRNTCFRWRTSAPGVQTFSVDHPVKYWTIYARALTGPGMYVVSVGGGAPEMDFVDQLVKYGPFTVFGVVNEQVQIRTERRQVSVRALATTTTLDVLIVAHNGGVAIN